MSSNPRLEIRVGLFFIIAVMLLTTGWSWLKGLSILHPPQKFNVMFSDVAGLNTNAPVNINGVRVGVVEKIQLLQPEEVAKLNIVYTSASQPSTSSGSGSGTGTGTGSATVDPATPSNQPADGTAPSVTDPPQASSASHGTGANEGPRAMVNCSLKINTESVTIPEGSSITIQTQGLVGAKYIEITLPEYKNGEEIKYISEGEVIRGQDPIRTELVLNKIATKLNDIVTSVGSEEVGVSLADALKHSGEAVSAFNQAAKKLDKNMDRFEGAADAFTDTSKKVGDAATEAKSAVHNAGGFFRKGEDTLSNVDSLTREMRNASGKVNKLLDNPAMSSDLKETVQLAKQTADSIGVTIKQLNTTLGDQPMRQDLITMLSRVNDSVNSIERSVKTMDKLAEDRELRSDIKDLIGKARETMDKFANVVNDPQVKSDLPGTMSKVRDAATKVDVAAEQLSQVLNKRAPLLQMLFASPGKLKKPKETVQKVEKTEKVEKDEKGQVKKIEKTEKSEKTERVETQPAQ